MDSNTHTHTHTTTLTASHHPPTLAHLKQPVPAATNQPGALSLLAPSYQPLPVLAAATWPAWLTAQQQTPALRAVGCRQQLHCTSRMLQGLTTVLAGCQTAQARCWLRRAATSHTQCTQKCLNSSRRTDTEGPMSAVRGVGQEKLGCLMISPWITFNDFTALFSLVLVTTAHPRRLFCCFT